MTNEWIIQIVVPLIFGAFVGVIEYCVVTWVQDYDRKKISKRIAAGLK